MNGMATLLKTFGFDAEAVADTGRELAQQFGALQARVERIEAAVARIEAAVVRPDLGDASARFFLPHAGTPEERGERLCEAQGEPWGDGA